MKKILISLVAVLTMGGTCLAQSSQMATLKHGETVTYFYGDTALIAAHRAAVHGDEILLSSGFFKAEMNIEKVITIRGAGMEQDSISGNAPTVLTGNTYVRVPQVEGKHLEMEGINHTGTLYAGDGCVIYDATFFRCMFAGVTREGDSATWVGASFIHCRVHYPSFILGYQSKDNTLTFVNSIVVSPYIYYNSNSGVARYNFKNCIIINTESGGNYINTMEQSVLSNCIVYDKYNHSFPASTSLHNCVFNKDGLYANSLAGTNQTVNFANLFENFNTDNPYSTTNSYKLKAAAAETYVSADGTQIGIWGGANPFEALPSGPRVKYVSVGSQQADGKLKVTVELQ